MSAAAKDLGEGSGREMQQNNHTALNEFLGTDNPRHLRVLHALLRRPMPREQIDREAGCSNGPDLIAELRHRGLSVPCDRAPVIDRDGRDVSRGIYNLTAGDRRKIRRWLVARDRDARGGS